MFRNERKGACLAAYETVRQAPRKTPERSVYQGNIALLQGKRRLPACLKLNKSR
jgi:hypothetical protein